MKIFPELKREGSNISTPDGVETSDYFALVLASITGGNRSKFKEITVINYDDLKEGEKRFALEDLSTGISVSNCSSIPGFFFLKTDLGVIGISTASFVSHFSSRSN